MSLFNDKFHNFELYYINIFVHKITKKLVVSQFIGMQIFPPFFQLKENQLDFEQRILKQLEAVKAQAAANGKQKLIQKVSLPDSNTSMENTPPNVGAPPSKRARHSGNDEEHGEGEGGSHALAVVGQVRVPLQPQQKENLVMVSSQFCIFL
jgi:hypothetical protein